MAAHRLSAVLNLRERAEKAAMERLGEAVAAVRRAEDAVREARERAMDDRRGPAAAALWEVQEAAAERARREVAICEARLVDARSAELMAREHYLAKYKEAEVIRKVIASREKEALLEEAKREGKALDELTSVRRAQAKARG